MAPPEGAVSNSAYLLLRKLVSAEWTSILGVKRTEADSTLSGPELDQSADQRLYPGL